MATVIVSFTTKDVTVPAGKSQGKFVVSVDGMPDQSVDTSPVTFTDVPEGDHVASVQAQDSDGAPVGDKQVASFNVPPSTVTLQGADVVSVAVQ